MIRKLCSCGLIGLCCAVLSGFSDGGVPWDAESLFAAPQTFDAAEYATNGVRAVFYEGEPYQGKPTRVFAYYGLPEAKPGEKVPGIVLVHGGGGSAFVRWVKLWNSRGYAAIAMDTCGAVSGNAYGQEQRGHVRHAWAGPPGWGGFDRHADPPRDQWTYHAVAAVVRGHSLLRSLPEVDGSRVGITGISWGGYLTCIAAAVDNRFAFAVPVYGCGFLGDNSAWLENFAKMGAEGAARWLGLWDPSAYLAAAKMPFLWVTGSNDFAYPMDSLQKSYRALKVPYKLCVRLRMPHGHGAAGENPAEILAFADEFTRGVKTLPRFTQVQREGLKVTARFVSGGRPVVKAELNHTADRGKWQERVWSATPVPVDVPDKGMVEAELPAGASVYYINIFTEDGLAVSTEHEEVERGAIGD